MSINVQAGLLVHSSGSRTSTYAIDAEGGLRVRVANPAGTNLDEMTPSERRELTRFLLADLALTHPDIRLADFVAGSPEKAGNTE